MGMLLKYDSGKLEEYILKLKTIASFSKLFSQSNSPYIHSRSAENIYCDCLGAINVSRADCTADAIYGKVGVGIKTFVATSNQKIAEFNGLRPSYAHLHGIELAKAIAGFRNNRIDVTMRSYGLSDMIYHYTVREPGTIKVFEEKMNRIDVNNIVLLEETNKKISFTDGLETYDFNFSKSTLYKKFDLDHPFLEFEVSIITEPLEALIEYLRSQNSPSTFDYFTLPQEPNTLIIPLYTEDKKGNRKVWEKSGLNQWNAGGRARNSNEVYINFPAKIRNEHSDFFPPRDTKWDLRLPDGNHLSMKICQDNDKAIMSDPNKALGKWLLRDVLNLEEGTLLTYEYLLEVGIDSVKFKKEAEGQYSVDFVSFDD